MNSPEVGLLYVIIAIGIIALVLNFMFQIIILRRISQVEHLIEKGPAKRSPQSDRPAVAPQKPQPQGNRPLPQNQNQPRRQGETRPPQRPAQPQVAPVDRSLRDINLSLKNAGEGEPRREGGRPQGEPRRDGGRPPQGPRREGGPRPPQGGERADRGERREPREPQGERREPREPRPQIQQSAPAPQPVQQTTPSVEQIAPQVAAPVVSTPVSQDVDNGDFGRGRPIRRRPLENGETQIETSQDQAAAPAPVVEPTDVVFGRR